MLILHDPGARDSIRSRIQALPAAARRRWGAMSVEQMVWHCNQVLRTSLGDMTVVERRPPFPVAVLKLILFHLPWPHGLPTAPEYQAHAAQDFEAERAQCLDLIDRFTARELDGSWPPFVFGPLSGRQWSRLQLRHLDYHLSQFSG